VVDKPGPGDGFLLIGDKVFDYEGRFEKVWDLSVEWTAMTGLPFVFAVWVARRTVPTETLQSLESALRYGIQHIREAIAHYGHSGKPYAYDYLTRNIDQIFDDQKHKALSLYIEYGRKLLK
jgi:chorismate dehydratase